MDGIILNSFVSLPVIFGLILSFILLWIFFDRQKTSKNLPPFPVPPKIILGHLLDFSKNYRVRLREWREKAGDVYSLKMGNQLYIVVSGYQNIKELLISNAENIPDAPKSLINDILGETNKGIVGASGENWKEQRSVSLSILRSFGMGTNILAVKIQEEVAEYVAGLAGLKGKPADVRLLTNVSVSNIICSIIVGKRFHHDDHEFVRLIGFLGDIVKFLPQMQLLIFMPILRFLPGDFFNAKKMTRCVLDVNNLFCKFYIEKIEKDLRVNEEPDNFIAAYLLEMKKRERNQADTKLDRSNLISVIRNLFIAGTETTSTTILWFMLFMLHYPEVQDKIYEEINAKVGNERVPGMHDRAGLVYLNAVVMETQRLANVAPSAPRKQVRVSFTMGGYAFPTGSVVVPFLDSVLHDSKIWGDAEHFRPERFIDLDGQLLQPPEFIPFSIGRRACLGESMAKMELFLFLSAVMQRFKLVAAVDGELPPLDGECGGTYVPRPFQLRFVERRGLN